MISYPLVLSRGAENSNEMFLAISCPMLRTTMLVVETPGVVRIDYDLRAILIVTRLARLPW